MVIWTTLGDSQLKQTSSTRTGFSNQKYPTPLIGFRRCLFLQSDAVIFFSSVISQSTGLNILKISEKVLSIVEEIVNGTDFETLNILDFDFDGDIDVYSNLHSDLVSGNEDDEVFGVEELDSSDGLSQQVSQEWEEESVDGVTFTYQEMVNIVNFYEKAKKNKFDQTKRRFKKNRHYKTIQRIKKYVDKTSTTFPLFKEVEKFVLERFESAHCNLHLCFDHFFVQHHYHPLSTIENNSGPESE
ncbi:hypothetical protein Fcan01_16505 [Folsomia candida]|uniref:Uncharacterized protein n=1 Tax=Folsomia candida TaxID=158441 RepID=A0A226DUZ2_FOLCA|nr:hypothetical protein Fcan01_16505 [Folsomia candida]